MAQPTYLQVFTDAIANLVVSSLVDPIVSHFKDHPDDEINKEVLLGILKLPASQPAARTPQRATGTPVAQPLTATVPKRTRSTKSTGERPQCKWIFTKGTNTGKRCLGSVAEDSEFCSACKNKKGAGGTGRKASGTGAAAVTGGKPTSKSSKTGFTATSKAKEVEQEEATQEISVDEFGTSTDGHALLIDGNTNFILKEFEDEYTVVGYCDDPENKTMKPLTKQQKEQAKKILQLDFEDGVELAE